MRASKQTAALISFVVFAMEVAAFVIQAEQQKIARTFASDVTQGERVIKALRQAYPEQIGDAVLRDGDWAALVNGEWYYWAEGRLLPGSARAMWEDYAPYRFYNYPLGALPPFVVPDPRTVESLKASASMPEDEVPGRPEGFLDALLRTGSPGETASRISRVRFLGWPVDVHEIAAPALREVSREVEAAGKTDASVAAFISGIASVSGFNYRNIAGTPNRSYHGFGLAVDITPVSYGGKETYWRWAMAKGEDWWAVPYTRRWMVPQPVVQAFERNGFVWGGKWTFFDTMHFEYRPEVVILAKERDDAGGLARQPAAGMSDQQAPGLLQQQAAGMSRQPATDTSRPPEGRPSSQ